MTPFQDKRRMEFFNDHNNLRGEKKTPFNRLMLIFSHIEQWQVRVEAQRHLIHKVDTDCPLLQAASYLNKFINDGIFTLLDKQMLQDEYDMMLDDLESMSDTEIKAMYAW